MPPIALDRRAALDILPMLALTAAERRTHNMSAHPNLPNIVQRCTDLQTYCVVAWAMQSRGVASWPNH